MINRIQRPQTPKNLYAKRSNLILFTIPIIFKHLQQAPCELQWTAFNRGNTDHPTV